MRTLYPNPARLVVAKIRETRLTPGRVRRAGCSGRAEAWGGSSRQASALSALGLKVEGGQKLAGCYHSLLLRCDEGDATVAKCPAGYCGHLL